MGKKLAIEHHLIRPNEVIELLEMMGGKNKDNADGCSYLYYTLCTPKINNPNNDKVICGFTNLKMQSDFFDIFTIGEFWKKYPYKLNDVVLCDDGLLGVVTKMEWDCEKSDMKYHISFKLPVDNKWYSSKNIKCKFMEAKGKKLAILGHKTRGHEVIELLKIMGGKICAFDYDSDGYAYYIDTSNMIICSNENTIKQNLDTYQLFTLEEFWEKYPFKLGDKVIDKADGCPGVVCEMKWDESISDMKYCVSFGNGIDFGWYANDSINYFKIKKIENLEETQSKREYDELRMPLDDDDKLATEATIMGKKILPPDGYLVGKITQTDNGMLVEYVEKKPKYPNNFDDCFNTVADELNDNKEVEYFEYKYDLLDKFKQLLICRDAYWKIAGEELGLGKPWKPDWISGRKEEKYCIATQNNEIWHNFSEYGGNEILAFPTIEMRDAFYENFKDLIEQCKELL